MELRFTPSFFDSEVIPGLESILAGSSTTYEFDTDSVIVSVDNSICSFFYDLRLKRADFNNADYTCSTSDFLQIILSWREFQRTSDIS